MTESISLRQLQVVEDQLLQIRDAIHNLLTWNTGITCSDDLLKSHEGMKTLAADCMLIEAIGEGIRRIDERTKGLLLPHRPEIPWQEVKGMRDHIAHGYFDINTGLVWDVIENDLAPLLEAVNYFIKNLYTLIPINEE